ncbi:Bcr/CflA family drug resistance efflux transporter, partial [Achromobacter xylosoxidans]
MAPQLLAALMDLAAWRWAPSAAWIFMLPVAVLTVGFSLAVASALSQALEPFADRAGTAAAVYGLFQMCGSAVIATPLLHHGVGPEGGMGLIGVLIVG